MPNPLDPCWRQQKCWRILALRWQKSLPPSQGCEAVGRNSNILHLCCGLEIPSEKDLLQGELCENVGASCQGKFQGEILTCVRVKFRAWVCWMLMETPAQRCTKRYLREQDLPEGQTYTKTLRLPAPHFCNSPEVFQQAVTSQLRFESVCPFPQDFCCHSHYHVQQGGWR